MKSFSIAVLSLAIVISTLCGCGRKERQSGKIIEREGKPDVTDVDDDDPRMLAAIAKARSTVQQFIDALARPQPSQSMFSLKAAIRDGKEVEHMWLTPVTYDGSQFSGTVNNDPCTIKTIKIGDHFTVRKEEISDWMYIDNRKLIGGYTIRLLRDMAPPEKRAEFDRTVPFTIE